MGQAQNSWTDHTLESIVRPPSSRVVTFRERPMRDLQLKPVRESLEISVVDVGGHTR
ncbi:MAG TPA: hypothetical protein VKA15_24665 [Isosphaeraceae bacterium]|nr:hypothetical protein [Isosphaeraceae bacterium]